MVNPKPPEYTAASITLLTIDESVRKRPAMYFGAGRDSPILADQVVRTVVSSLGWDSESEPADARLVVEGDLRFTVSAGAVGPEVDKDGAVRIGHGAAVWFRWPVMAAASVSVRTRLEFRVDGRLWSQELRGIKAQAPPAELGPVPGRGLVATFELDADFFAPGVTITRDLDRLRCYEDGTLFAQGPDSLAITDLRAR